MFLFGCSTPKSFQIECQSVSVDAAYILDVTTESKKELKDLNTIKLEAIDGVLFRGISGPNCVTQKPILTQSKSELKSNKFINSILGKKKGYDKYVTSISKLNTSATVDFKKTTIIYKYRVSINKELLRKDLTEAGILKSLNTGF
jgi:hypothetical protein